MNRNYTGGTGIAFNIVCVISVGPFPVRTCNPGWTLSVMSLYRPVLSYVRTYRPIRSCILGPMGRQGTMRTSILFF